MPGHHWPIYPGGLWLSRRLPSCCCSVRLFCYFCNFGGFILGVFGGDAGVGLLRSWAASLLAVLLLADEACFVPTGLWELFFKEGLLIVLCCFCYLYFKGFNFTLF